MTRKTSGPDSTVAGSRDRGVAASTGLFQEKGERQGCQCTCTGDRGIILHVAAPLKVTDNLEYLTETLARFHDSTTRAIDQ